MSRKRREHTDTSNTADEMTIPRQGKDSQCDSAPLVEEEDFIHSHVRQERRVQFPEFALSPSVAITSCYRRLLRDLSEFQRENLQTVSASPLENNLLEWHLNLTDPIGTFAGVYIHCVMKFPLAYPSVPPNIEILTPIPHPNVLGNFVCLSMLTSYGSGRAHPFEGWSSAYSVTSILYQLQSFFFAENAGRDHDEYFPRKRNPREDESAKEKAREYSCVTCGHTHDNPHPYVLLSFRGDGLPSSRRSIQSDTEEMSNEDEEDQRDAADEDDENHFDKWAELPQDCCLVVLQFLDTVSLHCASWTTRSFQSVFDKFSLGARNTVRCFHTKLSYSESVLGFGFRKLVSGMLTSQMEYLCRDAWQSGVRQDVWGSRLDFFIPLILNAEHGSRAFSLLMKSFQSIVGRHKCPVFGVAKLMNDLVVMLAKNVCGDAKSKDCCCHCQWDCSCLGSVDGMMKVNLSQKTLLGYASLHHILLYLVEHDEWCRKTVRKTVEKLVTGRIRRNQVPNLGVALIFLSTMTDDVYWDDISKAVTLEEWIRKVRQFTKEIPDWNAPSVENYQDIFWTCGVSLCVDMFQVKFLELVCGTSDERKKKKKKNKTATKKKKSSRVEKLNDYNRRLGQPSRESDRKLRKFCFEMKDVMRDRNFSKMYLAYWKTLGFRAVSGQEFVYLLRDSVRESKRIEYHHPASNEWYLWHTPHGFSARDCFVRRSFADDEKDKLVLIDVKPRGCRRDNNFYDQTRYDNYDQHYPQRNRRQSCPPRHFSKRFHNNQHQHRSYDKWYNNHNNHNGRTNDYAYENNYEYEYEYYYEDRDQDWGANDSYDYLADRETSDQMTTTSPGTSPEFGFHNSEADMMSQCMSSPTPSDVNGPSLMTPRQQTPVSFIPVPISVPIGYMISPAMPSSALPPVPPGVNGSVGMPIGFIPNHPMMPPGFMAPPPPMSFGGLPAPGFGIPMTAQGGPAPGWFLPPAHERQRQYE